jgi:PAS domain S-box-containing protein
MSWGVGSPEQQGVDWATMTAEESRLRVLHVDDDEAYREAYREAVAGAFEDVSLETAGSIAETRAVLDEQEFHCVVLDHGLPDGTGIELLREDAFGETPVVLLTGQGDESLAAEAIQAGVAGYFPKGEGADGIRSVAEAARRHASEYRRKREITRLRRRCELVADVVAEAVFEWRVDDDEATIHGGDPFGYDAFGEVLDVEWWRERVHPEDRARVLDSFETVLEERRERHEIEYRFRRADGDYADVRMTSRFVYDEDETIAVGALADVSDRRERERELERRNERLDRFASVVSHDLRNPLAVAEGYLQLARETGDESHLDEARAALDRIGELIEDLLELARTGRGVGEVGPVSLSGVATEAWEGVATAGHTLRVVEDATVRADRSRLRQLFENLFANAVEHGSAGGQVASDDTDEHGSTGNRTGADDAVERGDADGGGVTVAVGTLDDGFYVADDGIGIPEEIEETLFETGVTGATDGTGFGLAIVREVAENHGWRVDASNDEDGGARFEFRGVAFD